MENKQPVDVLSVVALTGVVGPAEVELVCLAVCNACRESSANYSVRIDANNKHVLSSRQETAALPPAAGTVTSRVVPLRRIWRLAVYVDLRLTEVTWPEDLRVLRFGWKFNHPLESLLPSSLLKIDLGGTFNHHIEAVAWPPRLLELHFSDRFNRPIELATWPATLQCLTFGSSFNQPIEAVEWPPCLQSLILGSAFNHPILSVNWSATSIKKVVFGVAFRQPVLAVEWPSELEELAFGGCFDQELDTLELPRSLQMLRLPDLYDADDDGDLLAGLPEDCVLCVQEVTLDDEDSFPF